MRRQRLPPWVGRFVYGAVIRMQNAAVRLFTGTYVTEDRTDPTSQDFTLAI